MLVDTLLDQRYAIHDDLAPLGSGGMAIIYAGTDTRTDTEIAAKTLLPQYQGDTERRARFRNEAAVLAAVQNPHVVDLIDVIDGRRGTWILMERLHGDTLRTKLKRGSSFRLRTIAQWLTDIAAGLEEMHRRGYVHLDVTPQNIVVPVRGPLKLIDFGIAQEAWRPPQRDGDKLLGTAAYLSPEHGSGQDVTPAADVYSLGCVVFELLTGLQVFSEHHPSSDATVALRQHAIPALPTIVAPEKKLPDWVDDVVASAIQPRQEDRYPSVTAFAEAFATRANPPLLRISWPRRPAATPAPVASRTVAIAEPPTETVDIAPRPERRPSIVSRWVRHQAHHVRRAVLMPIIMVVLILGALAFGGETIADAALGVLPGSEAATHDGQWRIRTEPGEDSSIVALLPEGESVEITNAPVFLDGYLWWPVSADGGSGWIRDDAIPGSRSWLMDSAGFYMTTRHDIESLWDDATDWIPGR